MKLSKIKTNTDKRGKSNFPVNSSHTVSKPGVQKIKGGEGEIIIMEDCLDM